MRYQGYILKEADYVEKVMVEDELWSIFSGMFSGRAVHDISYKYGFFKSILDSIYSTDDNLWNLVLTCSVCNLRKSDKLAPQQYVDRLVERNGVMMERNPNELPFYKENKPREVYYWEKYNRYHEIWVPEKRVVV